MFNRNEASELVGIVPSTRTATGFWKTLSRPLCIVHSAPFPHIPPLSVPTVMRIEFHLIERLIKQTLMCTY